MVYERQCEVGRLLVATRRVPDWDYGLSRDYVQTRILSTRIAREATLYLSDFTAFKAIQFKWLTLRSCSVIDHH